MKEDPGEKLARWERTGDFAMHLTTEKGEVACHLGDNPDPSKRANHGVPPESWTPLRLIDVSAMLLSSMNSYSRSPPGWAP